MTNKYGNVSEIAQYNRDNGTNFYTMEQVEQHKKENNPSFLTRLAQTAVQVPVTSGVSTSTATSLRDIPKVESTVGNELGYAAGLLTTPMLLGEIGTYGPLVGALRLGAGTAGSAAGSYVAGKAGDFVDKKLGTNWIGNTGRILGGFAGFIPGMNLGYKGAIKLASKAPSIARVGSTPTFRSDVVGKAFGDSVKDVNFIPAQVKYYGPTMGKSYAARTNDNIIDLDTWGRQEYDVLAKKYGYSGWRDMILSDKGDYNAEYKALIKDQINRIQSNPQYAGKTIVVSNASFLKPESGIRFESTPVIPERSVMAQRNHARHPWETVQHGEEWWDSLQSKGIPLKIDNRFVSEIEGNKVINAEPTIPKQNGKTLNIKNLYQTSNKRNTKLEFALRTRDHWDPDESPYIVQGFNRAKYKGNYLDRTYKGEFTSTPQESFERRNATGDARVKYMLQHPTKSVVGPNMSINTTFAEELDAASRRFAKKYANDLPLSLKRNVQYNQNLNGDYGKAEGVIIGPGKDIGRVRIAFDKSDPSVSSRLTEDHEIGHATGNYNDGYIYNLLRENGIVDWDNVSPYFKDADRGEIGQHLAELVDFLGLKWDPKQNALVNVFGKNGINSIDVSNFTKFLRKNGFNTNKMIWGNINDINGFVKFMNEHPFAIAAPTIGIGGATLSKQKQDEILKQTKYD